MTTDIDSLIDSNVYFFDSAISDILDIDDFALHGGRPYGGIGILWYRNLDIKCSVLDFGDSYRCLAAKIEYNHISLVCVNVYLPTLCNTDDYEVNILNCFAFIDNIFTQHMDTCSNFIEIGDFNFDLTKLKNCMRLGVIQDFVDEYNLIACDHLDGNKVGYTYRHEELHVRSKVDRAFVF